ncbi:MAG: hypothetical protein WC544_00540 [Patescibacteria group bacterium]
MPGPEKTLAVKSKKPLIIIVVFAIFLGGGVWWAHSSPSKFASWLPGGGVSVTRDDQELSVYFERVGFVRAHSVPYKENRIEYPILGTMYLSLPALASGDEAGYALWLMILNSLSAVALMYVTYRLLALLGRPHSLLWLFFLPGVAYFTLNRFDIWPALLVQLSLLMLFTKRWNWAFVLLCASFLAKGYAILLFPIFFAYWLSQTKRPEVSLWKNKPLWLLVGPVLVVILLMVAMAGGQNGLFPYYFQSTRGFAFGSAYTIYIIGLTFLIQERWLVIMIGIATKVMLLVQFILPALMYGGYAFFRRFIRQTDDVVHWSTIVIAVYILFSPYYSPQWLLWLVPLLLLWRASTVAGLAAFAYGLMAYLEFPIAINVFGFDSIQYNMLVLARTVLLVSIVVIGAVQLRRRADTAVPPAPLPLHS